MAAYGVVFGLEHKHRTFQTVLDAVILPDLKEELPVYRPVSALTSHQIEQPEVISLQSLTETKNKTKTSCKNNIPVCPFFITVKIYLLVLKKFKRFKP